jgi:hypothetical protein
MALSQPSSSDSSGTASIPTATEKPPSSRNQSQPSALIPIGVLLGVTLAITLLRCVCFRRRRRVRKRKRKRRGGPGTRSRTEVRIVRPAAARPRTTRERDTGPSAPANYTGSAPETMGTSMSGTEPEQTQNTPTIQAWMGGSMRPPPQAYMFNAMSYLECDLQGSSYAGNSIRSHRTPYGAQDEEGSVQTPLGRRAVTDLPLPGEGTPGPWGQSGYRPPGYETDSTCSSSTR